MSEPTPAALLARPEQAMAKRFARDTEGFEMAVAHDSGPYKHLKFRSPKTSIYWYDLIVWPGTLTIRGDMGTFVFAREKDMLAFFRGKHVNPGYWAEKEVTRAETKQFDEDRASRLLREHIAQAEDDYEPEHFAVIERAAEDCIQDDDWLYADGAHRLLSCFRVQLPDGSYFELHDTWEWDLTEWTAQYLWCCVAIVDGIRQYDAGSAKRSEDAHCDWCGSALVRDGASWVHYRRLTVDCSANTENGVHEPAAGSEVPNRSAVTTADPGGDA